MKKLLLASAISALFAAPATVLAQAKPPAAPPVPTLDKILEASGISVSGYIDAGYTYASKNVQPGTGTAGTGGFSTRVFDQQNNSFALNQFGLTVAKQPKEGFGGLVNITVGRDAEYIHSFPEATGPGTPMFDITQAFAQYADGPMTLIAGKFVTLQGTEVIASTGNTNISRSILFGAIPFTHTGVRGTWAVSDTVSLIAGLNNGWDQLTDANKGKTVELGVTLNPIKPLNIVVSAYSGKENTAPSGAALAQADGNRTSLDAVVTYTVIDPLTLGVEFLSVSQDHFVSLVNGSSISAKYSGTAGYVTYMFSPKFRGALRGELFNDKDGARFGKGPTATTSATKYAEVTFTGSYLPTDSFELRAEGRSDKGSNPVFVDFTTPTPATSKTMTTIALQGIYKF
ncbi:MAG TPA: outer membrane beta-barrel protein [Burkholderiales bacterium]